MSAMNTHTQTVSDWLSQLGAALTQADVAGALNLFVEDCYWRDLVSFTWNIKTLEGKDEIRAMLAATLADTQPCHWQVEGEAVAEGEVIRCNFTFETAHARGRGILRLKGGQCWTLLTTMVELKGYEEKHGATRELGVQYGAHKGRKSWLELKTQNEAELGYTRQPYCVIVGGGQGGIALGARLKRLDGAV